jgi:hypothetical protein
MFLLATLFLILKFADLKEMNTDVVLEISLHSISVLLLPYNYLKINKELRSVTELKTKLPAEFSKSHNGSLN